MRGIRTAKSHLVGNVMIDTLRALLPKAKERNTPAVFDLTPGEYGRRHAPSSGNVDCEGDA